MRSDWRQAGHLSRTSYAMRYAGRENLTRRETQKGRPGRRAPLSTGRSEFLVGVRCGPHRVAVQIKPAKVAVLRGIGPGTHGNEMADFTQHGHEECTRFDGRCGCGGCCPSHCCHCVLFPNCAVSGRCVMSCILSKRAGQGQTVWNALPLGQSGVWETRPSTENEPELA